MPYNLFRKNNDNRSGYFSLVTIVLAAFLITNKLFSSIPEDELLMEDPKTTAIKF
jgi:hypothetical protein